MAHTLITSARLGFFKLVGEESVAAGTRRITALTGKAALDYVRQEEDLLADVASVLKVPTNLVGERVAALLEEVKTLKKQAFATTDRNGPARLGRRLAGRRDRAGRRQSCGSSRGRLLAG